MGRELSVLQSKHLSAFNIVWWMVQLNHKPFIEYDLVLFSRSHVTWTVLDWFRISMYWRNKLQSYPFHVHLLGAVLKARWRVMPYSPWPRNLLDMFKSLNYLIIFFLPPDLLWEGDSLSVITAIINPIIFMCGLVSGSYSWRHYL